MKKTVKKKMKTFFVRGILGFLCNELSKKLKV
jgi:hypothetical protein